MKLLIFFGSLICLQPIYSQTCIIAVIKPEEILVGADSRNNNNGIPISDSMCKIRCVRNFNVTLSGGPGGQVMDSLLKYIAHARTAAYLKLLLQDEFDRGINKMYNDLHVTGVRRFDSTEHLNHFALQFFIFGNEAESLFFWYGAIQLTEIRNNSVKVRTIIKEINNPARISMGHNSELLAKKLLDDPSTWKGGTIRGIKSLIDTAAKYHPGSVGGKYDIVKVSRAGRSWISQKPRCAALNICR